MKILLASDEALRSGLIHALVQFDPAIEIFEASSYAQILFALTAHRDLAIAFLDVKFLKGESLAPLNALVERNDAFSLVMLVEHQDGALAANVRACASIIKGSRSQIMTSVLTQLHRCASLRRPSWPCSVQHL